MAVTPDDFPLRRVPKSPTLQWVVMGVAMLGWAFLMAAIGSQLRQIFQPLGIGFAAMVFFGAFVGVGAALIFMVLSPRQHCPECGGKLPRFRKPVSLGHMLWGGWECPRCHADLSPEGKRGRAMRSAGKAR